jgi:3alpha(or 20beta)-hydroxysteroid dehydrogenase
MGDGRLEGKVALVTGAAGGIGAAAARRLAREGARLLLTDADVAGARRVAQELGDERAAALGHDVTSEEQWQAVLAHALEAHGRVDVLLNNAGVFLAKPLTETSVEEFRRVLDVNFTGVFLGMRTVAPAMTERHAGSVIKGIPLRRIGQPEEVAEAIVYLASDESVYVTGAELAIDGGVTA